MDQYIFFILLALIIAFILALAVFAFLGYKFLKLKEQENKLPRSILDSVAAQAQAAAQPQKKEISADLIKALRKTEEKMAPAQKCVDHPDRDAFAACAISGDSFCESCMTQYKEMKIAKKFIDVYLSAEWVEVLTIPNDDHQHDVSERIKKIKLEFWKEKKLPLIVQGHYKINIQTDTIESFTVVFSRVKDKDLFQKELSFIQ